MARQRKKTAEASAPAPAPDLTVGERIDLDPRDYYLATWRALPPLPRPKADPPPFDRERCLEQLGSLSINSYGWWTFPSFPAPPSPQEAHFWLTVAARARHSQQPAELARELRREEFSGRLSGPEVAELFGQRSQAAATNCVLGVLPALLDLRAIVRFVLRRPGWPTAPNSLGVDWEWPTKLMHWLARELVPYLTPEDRKALEPEVREQLRRSTWPTNHYERPDPSFHAAAFLGMHPEVWGVVVAWPDAAYNRYSWDDDYYHQTQLVVFGLGSAELVQQHMRRMKLHLKYPLHVRAWLAHTGTSALDYVRDSIQALGDRAKAAEVFAPFALVKSPAAATPMLELKLDSKVPRQAREWLEANVGNAIAGLIPVAAGRGKLAEAAVEFLRDAKRKGHGDFIASQLSQAEPGVAERVRKLVLEHVEKALTPLDEAGTPGWLKGGPGQAVKLPGWLDLDLLPAVEIPPDHCLNREQVREVLGALKGTPLGSASPLLEGLRKNAEPRSLDAFAWKVFELWLDEGAPPKEKWAMSAVGHLGGEPTVAKLTPLVRDWPGQSQHARAVHGLECLAAIGTDGALLAINGVAQKVKFKGLQNQARELMNRMAQGLGLSREELEDRIVPDLDLDERGRRVLDFGPRQFTVILGQDLSPVVRDAAGAIKKDLPKPGKSDDAEKAAEALGGWKLLKKQLKEVAKQQAFRLEQAMVRGRRWAVGDFERLLVRHPLLFNLVQRLLWGGYGDRRELRVPFRVTEERELVGVEGDPVSLGGVKGVGLVHPLQLSAEERQAWGEVFADCELMSPFPQLGRPVFGLEAGEEGQKRITRFAEVRIPGASVVGYLEGAGWERGMLHDHGDYHEHTKYFPGAGVTAVLEYEPGVWAGGLREAEAQQLTGCCFFPGASRDSWRKDEEALRLGEVDRVALSEVLLDLSALAARGK